MSQEVVNQGDERIRDADRTRQGILDAVGALLAEQGFSGIGVNAVARRAGVDKVLIYRYFGGLEGLFEAFADAEVHWPTNEELLGPVGREALAQGDNVGLLVEILRGHLRELRSRPTAQEIMRWELHERNALTDALARVREERGLELVEMLSSHAHRWPGLDVAAAGSLIHAGITYLLLRARITDQFAGIDLRSEEGWDRIAGAIEPLVRGAFEHATTAPATNEDAANGDAANEDGGKR